MASFDRVADPT